jgi:hypothetical protein
MMRIEPDRNTLPALRPTASSASAPGFASALSSARNSADTSLPESTDKSHAAETPIAEQWGQYGSGATAEGYGTPPDPSQYSDAPKGPHQPASPLNPSGVTTTPGFTVDGYTARGTPVPPGFYNLAYYNWYLRDGGTPLPGFPALADGATITETYGKFGDNAERATSFVTAAGAGSVSSGGVTTISAAGSVAASADATSAPEPTGATSVTIASGGVAAAVARSATPITSSPSYATPAPSPAASGTSVAATSTAAQAGVLVGPASTEDGDTVAKAARSMPQTTDLEAALRADLTTLLGDLLRA